jgi:hypothetical protein
MWYDNISFDGIISKEVVSDVYVFDYRILTRVVSNLDDTIIIT